VDRKSSGLIEKGGSSIPYFSVGDKEKRVVERDSVGHSGAGKEDPYAATQANEMQRLKAGIRKEKRQGGRKRSKKGLLQAGYKNDFQGAGRGGKQCFD